MLEDAYGLLEANDAAELRAHLANCVPCTAALDETRRMQSLLGRAAKLDCSNVTFEPPLAEVKKSARQVARTTPWIAAGLMLMLGTPIAMLLLNTPAHVAIDTGSKQPPPVDPGTSVPGRPIVDAAHEWSADGKYHLQVNGPKPATPNAVNEYSVTAKDSSTESLTVRVTVLVKDAAGKVYFKESFETPKTLKLPAAKWAEFPQKGVTLHVLATHPKTQDKVELAIPLRD